MNGVTTAALSRPGAQRNCSLGEDAGYPRWDGKTPWSFTAAWHCISGQDVQDRWEAAKPGRQLRWSHP